jgi:hypothetical protein
VDTKVLRLAHTRQLGKGQADNHEDMIFFQDGLALQVSLGIRCFFQVAYAVRLYEGLV